MTEKNEWTEIDEARLERLMRAVPRGSPDPAARARVFDAVQAEWRRSLPQPAQARPVQRARWLAAASVAAVALAGMWWWQSPASPVATADRAFGTVTVAGGPLATGARIRPGTSLVTAADSGALLRYSPDLSLRLDANTRVTLTDAQNLHLAGGRIYVAVAPGAAVPYVVHTAAGDVRHVGTHYVVDARGGGLDIAVRDGTVRLDAGSRAERVGAGEALHVDAGGAVVRRAFEGDTPWAWVDRLPTPIVIEGQSLASFLRWYAAESGREVTFADDAIRARAAAAILHGSVDGLPPAAALAIVVASVDLRAVVPRQGPIVIGPALH
ncbi:MAG: FecR domain-containing protein [Steroidobacteraceae bacterium]